MPRVRLPKFYITGWYQAWKERSRVYHLSGRPEGTNIEPTLCNPAIMTHGQRESVLPYECCKRCLASLGKYRSRAERKKIRLVLSIKE